MILVVVDKCEIFCLLIYIDILIMGGFEFIIHTSDISINIDIINSFMNMKHRGPDDSNYITISTDNLNNLNNVQQQSVQLSLTKDEIRTYKQYNFIFSYHRLCINDISYNASQPFEDPIINKLLSYPELRQRPDRKLLCNGEIYNYIELKDTNEFTDKDLSSNCDVEIILPLYIKNGLEQTLSDINGEYSFILTENIKTFDLSKVNVFVCRDYLGMRPLYYVRNNDMSLCMFVSEIKALPLYILNNLSYTIKHVLPGTYWSFQKSIIQKNDGFIEYFSLDKYKDLELCVNSSTQPDALSDIYKNLQDKITKSIISRFITSDHKVGILLSGGFDSSLMLSIVVKYLVDNNHDFTNNPLNVFTIGDQLAGDDLDCEKSINIVSFLENKYAIDIHHHIINVNCMTVLNSDIDKIIYHLESYEPETVRESLPFYYLLNYIKTKTNVRVLLTGDGLDELGGYENFNNLNDKEFQEKSIKLLQNLCKFDLMRTDRIANMFGLEVRHPYLDKNLIEYILTLHPKLRRPGYYNSEKPPISKYIFRKAFETNVYGSELISYECLWREHYCLCHSLTNFELRLTNYLNNLISDDEFNTFLNHLLSELNINMKTIPKTKEQMYYRKIFRQFYPNRDYLIDIFWNDLWD
jgi:asparagine synthase (glutamine-hydrolysing)